MGSGEAVAYAIFMLQDRGEFFIDAGQPVYEGLIVGEHAKESDSGRQPDQSEETDQRTF